VRSARDGADHVAALLRLYDDALPEIHGYLRARCASRDLAEDLTADTFLAALGQAQRGAVDEVTTAWLIGIARHKLLDHWRRAERTAAVARGSDDRDDPADQPVEDQWDVVIERQRVGSVLGRLGPHHRSALVLRYVDDLSVPEVAAHLDRTVHATEALLVRARQAFRRVDEGSEP
jgi:RNA polymerase sigma-70 factor (ECF subfamily)